MIIEKFKRVKDLLMVISFRKREMKDKTFSWWNEIPNAKSQQYLSLVDTYRYRVSIYDYSPESREILNSINNSSWFNNPKSDRERFCSQYVKYLTDLRDNKDCSEHKKILSELNVSSFVKNTLIP